MTTNLMRRRCNGPTCITILSTYNNDEEGLCGACRKKVTDEWIARIRDQAEREPMKVPETRPHSKTWRILRAMPGTSSQIAEATGLPLNRVRITVKECVKDGRARGVNVKKVGQGGERTSYECIVELPGPTGAAAMPKYTRESLIESLHQMRRYLERVPMAKDCGVPWPSRTAFKRVFGTFSAALTEAGMSVHQNPREDIVKYLEGSEPVTSREIAKKLGRNQNAVICDLTAMSKRGEVVRDKQSSGGYLYRLAEREAA